MISYENANQVKDGVGAGSGSKRTILARETLGYYHGYVGKDKNFVSHAL